MAIVNTLLGEFFIGEKDHMAAHLTPQGRYEPEVEDAIREHVKPGMVVADIGANLGYFARLLCEQVGPTGQVHCVEPHPDTFGFLSRNVREPQAHLHRVAASDEDGVGRVWQHTVNSGDSRMYESPEVHDPIPVRTARLEGVVPPLDFVLADCQGYEIPAFEGLGAHRPPRAVVEFWPEGIVWAGGSADGTLDAYREMGYRITPAAGAAGWSDKLGSANFMLERRA